MKIQVLGSGCAKCKLLEEHAKEATAGMAGAAVEKVTDIETIVEMGVMSTPALVVDGIVKSVGRVLTTQQIAAIIKGGA